MVVIACKTHMVTGLRLVNNISTRNTSRTATAEEFNMINRTQHKKLPILCKNCLNMKDDSFGKSVFSLPKDKWLCNACEIIDLLDGSVSCHTCLIARKDEKLCGPSGQRFKGKP